MIVMTMRGGLGNQLFEYAFARTISLHNHNEKIYLYVGRFAQDKQREYALNNFRLAENVKIIENPIWLRVYIKFFEAVRKMMHLDIMSDRDALYLYKYGYYNYLGRKYVELPSNKLKIKYYSTLAQNRNYFYDYKDIILSELGVKTEPTVENSRWIQRIISTKNSVCVHIRRGDYVNHPLYNVCTDEYFKTAIRKMESIIAGTYFVFSDDIEYAQKLELEKVTSNIEYIDLDNPDYEELRLMSNCEHFILSNSTFSWWAQELSANNDKIIISPIKWKNSDDPEDSQLIDRSWILIE